MSTQEILTANFHAQLERLATSKMTIEKFMQDPAEQLAEETMESLRQKIRTEQRTGSRIR